MDTMTDFLLYGIMLILDNTPDIFAAQTHVLTPGSEFFPSVAASFTTMMSGGTFFFSTASPRGQRSSTHGGATPVFLHPQANKRQKVKDTCHHTPFIFPGPSALEPLGADSQAGKSFLQLASQPGRDS